MSEFFETASGVEDVEMWNGDRADLTVEVLGMTDHPDIVALGHGTGNGWGLTIEQAQELVVALTEAIGAAKLNRTRM